MGWMKLVANMQENNTLTLLKAALDKAIEYNLKYVHFDGEILTTDKARAIVTLLKLNRMIKFIGNQTQLPTTSQNNEIQQGTIKECKDIVRPVAFWGWTLKLRVLTSRVRR